MERSAEAGYVSIPHSYDTTAKEPTYNIQALLESQFLIVTIQQKNKLKLKTKNLKVSIPHSYDTTIGGLFMKVQKIELVSIPHSYDTTSKLEELLENIYNVSIPHSYDTTLFSPHTTEQKSLIVSIPHSYDTTSS